MSNPNDQIVHITPSGTSIKRVGEDHLHIDFKNIKSVGVKNIIDVEFHAVNTVLNSRSHLIRFRNGGEVMFAYNDKGCLIELIAKGVDLTLSSSDELMFFIKQT
jgi:hypothetical protein